MKKPIVIAHRGAPMYAPENTLSSFKKAIELGAEGIEFDVHLTKDGYVVVTHDEDISRTSNGKGLVKDFTLEQLKRLDFGNWFKVEGKLPSWFSKKFKGEIIPTLKEVLKLFSDLKWYGLINIELKNGVIRYEGLESKVVELVREFGVAERTIISSYNHYSLIEVKKIAPNIKTGALYVAGLVDPWEYAKKIGAEAIHPIFYNIIPEIVEGCKENGIAINTYTVDDVEMIKKIGMMGIDGIITNVPDIALKVLKELPE